MIWDIKQGQSPQVLLGHTAAITDIKFDEKGQFVATASFDRKTLLRNTDDLQNQPIELIDHEAYISSLAYSHDHLITGDFKGIVRRFPLDSRELVTPLCGKISRQLTEDEWLEFVADDIEQSKICNDE